MLDIRQIQASWGVDRPRFELFCQETAKVVTKGLARKGFQLERISYRVKTLDSLIQKCIGKRYESYDRVTDRAGIRAVLRFPAEVYPAAEAMQTILGGSIDDKPSQYRVNEFDYRSVHLDILGKEGSEWAGLPLEIQFRTVCDDTWAVMSHFLDYKSPVGMTAPQKRARAAIAGTLELIDREYERQYTEMKSDDNFSNVVILHGLEVMMTRLTGVIPSGDDYDRELSLEMIASLRQAYVGDNPEAIVNAIREYVDANEDALVGILTRGQREPERSVFLMQPESLLVGERLESRSMRLTAAWAELLPEEELVRLAAHFGKHIDAAD